MNRIHNYCTKCQCVLGVENAHCISRACPWYKVCVAAEDAKRDAQ